MVWGPLSFHDCGWGMSEVCVSEDMDAVPSPWAQLTMYTKYFIWEKTLLPLPLGLNWAPQKSPSHLFQAKFAWLLCPLLDPTNSLPRSRPCVTFHGHMVWDTPFVAMCVHMYVCVLPALLNHVAPSSIAVICPCHGCHLRSPGNTGATAGQGPLCGTQCESSLDGLLDLFN